MIPRLFIVLCVLAACTQSAEDQWEAHRRAAGETLRAQDEAMRAAFRRLPLCPAADTSGLRYEALIEAPLRIPKAFRPESTTYMHGGERFRKGDTLIAFANGHYGWASFTGDYGGGGVVPAGCVARLVGRIYIVTERRDSTAFHAGAVQVIDTIRVYGDRWLGITAPHSVRGWLLGLLTLRAPPAQFSKPWTVFSRNHRIASAFDSSRLTWRADTADVWVRSLYDELQRFAGDSIPSFTAIDRRLLVHCSSQSAHDVRMLMRDAAGDSVWGDTFPAARYVPFREHYFSPLLKDLCAGRPSAQRSR